MVNDGITKPSDVIENRHLMPIIITEVSEQHFKFTRLVKCHECCDRPCIIYKLFTTVNYSDVIRWIDRSHRVVVKSYFLYLSVLDIEKVQSGF